MAAPVLQAFGGHGRTDDTPRGPRRGVHPPRADEMAAVWDQPIPSDRPAAVWLLGAHGGAGVSTLCQWVSRAGDALGQWPAGHGRQSPFVVIVAEESVRGLARAHALARQYAANAAGPSAHLLGVVTVARVPGKRPQAVRHQRELLTGLVDELWAIPFVPGLNELALSELPSWELGDTPTTKKRPAPREAVPAPVATFAAAVMDEISAHLSARRNR